MIFPARRLLPLALLAALACLNACTALYGETTSTDPPETLAPEAVETDPGEVVFTGPWADEFDRAYRSAGTTAGRRALADGQITEAELAELKAVYIQCLEDLGFTDITVGLGGREEMHIPPELIGDIDKVLDLGKQCGTNSTDWNAIVALQYQIQGNPDHLDTAAIMAQCLVRVGLKPEGYTAEDYKADFSSGSFSDYYGTAENQKFIACNDDPAHAS